MFARTGGKDGDARGITVFLVPAGTPGLKIEEYLWTFNMPTDHPRVRSPTSGSPTTPSGAGRARPRPRPELRAPEPHPPGRRVPGRRASTASRRASSTPGPASRSARRWPSNQAIQWPLVELATQCEMLRLLIRKTAWQMDHMEHKEVERQISDKVSMCNYWANRLCCEAADRAMQVHGGIGYSRHKPFEHIYRHHRRYRITEGSEEIQMRKVAAFLFGYVGPRKKGALGHHLGRRGLPEGALGCGTLAAPSVRRARRRVAPRRPRPTVIIVQVDGSGLGADNRKRLVKERRLA